MFFGAQRARTAKPRAAMPAMVLIPLTEAPLVGLAAAGAAPELAAAGAPEPEAAGAPEPEAAGAPEEAGFEPEAAGAVALGWAPVAVERPAGVEVRVTPCYATRSR